MHAPFEPPAELLHTTWRHREGMQYYFDPVRIGELIERFNRTGEMGAIDELLQRSEGLIRSLIRYRRANRFVPLDELLSGARIKLIAMRYRAAGPRILTRFRYASN